MEPAAIIILGVNGNCIDIADAIELLAKQGQPLKVAGFLDDNAALQGQMVAGHPVLGRIADAPKFTGAKFVNGIGSPRSFKNKPAIIAATALRDDQWTTVVHPLASISPSAKLGAGTAILAGSSIGARVVVGNHTMILQNSVISHDSALGDYTAVATGVCVSGQVTIGANCYLGSGCCIREGIRIGDRALIGLGAVVTKDVPADAIVVGNPARPYRKSQ